jgi:hypothetical protein
MLIVGLQAIPSSSYYSGELHEDSVARSSLYSVATSEYDSASAILKSHRIFKIRLDLRSGVIRDSRLLMSVQLSSSLVASGYKYELQLQRSGKPAIDLLKK